jgi:hypothetical protein
MTLEEYKNIIEASESDKEYICNWCKKNFYTEEQADNYAIKFGEYLDSLTTEDMGTTPIKEFLEFFKKEKGL